MPEPTSAKRVLVIEVEAANNVHPRRLATVIRSVLADSTDDWLRAQADLPNIVVRVPRPGEVVIRAD